MAAAPAPRWYAIRRAQNRKPATYRCPLCGQHLPALSEHMLLFPEGRPEGRRHAHTRCVLAARRDGRLATREEFERTQPRPPGPLARLRARLGSRFGSPQRPPGPPSGQRPPGPPGR